MNTALPTLYAPTTDADFLRVFNRLCVALREPPDDTGMTQQTYFELLHDLPFTALEAGATALMRESGRRFFPTSAEWRTAAEMAQTAQLKAALTHREEPWHFDDDECRDSGWREHVCDGVADGPCGRAKKHAPHPYVTPCLCRTINRSYQRRSRFGAGA